MKTCYQLNMIIVKRKGIVESALNQSILIQEPEDRKTAHALLDEMMDRMGCPK